MNTVILVGEHPETFDVLWYAHETWELTCCTSWVINRQDDAEFIPDFGRPVDFASLFCTPALTHIEVYSTDSK